MAKYPNVYTKRVTVNSFLSGMRGTGNQKKQDLSKAKLFHNFDITNGFLKSGIGVQSFKENVNISSGSITLTALYPYIRYNAESGMYEEYIVYYASNKRLYIAIASGGDYEAISTVTFNEKPDVIAYNYLDLDVLLVSSPTDGLYLLDGKTLTKVDGAPPISSLCIHDERMFATGAGEGKSLWFSDDFDPTNWSISLTEAGFISFAGDQGKLLKAVSFLGYVYVFCEYGIIRVIATGDQQDFSVDNLYGKQGKIYGETVVSCGDFIIMLTSTGFYSFNGLTASKILSEYDDIILSADNHTAKGVFDGRKVYISLNVNVGGNVQNAVLCFDVRDKTSYISLGLNVLDVCYYQGSQNAVLCVCGNSLKPLVIDDSGNLLEEPLLKSWESDYCDFSISEKNKLLKKVVINAKGECTLTVKTKYKSVTYEILRSGQIEFYPCLNGESFKFIINSNASDIEVYKLTAFIDYVKESV